MDDKLRLQSSPGSEGSSPKRALSYLRATTTKLRVVSFLFGLTLSFFIVASYILTWDRRGLLITPAPSPLRPSQVVACSTNHSLEMRSLVRNILFKLDYTPRRVPAEREVIGSDPQVSHVVRLVDWLSLHTIALTWIGSINEIVVFIMFLCRGEIIQPGVTARREIDSLVHPRKESYV